MKYKGGFKQSQKRYNEKVPPISIRLPREALEILEEKEKQSNLTRSELMREYIMDAMKYFELVSDSVSSKAWNKGYEAGYEEAKHKFGVTFSYGKSPKNPNSTTVTLPGTTTLSLLYPKEVSLNGIISESFRLKLIQKYVSRKDTIKRAVLMKPSRKEKELRQLTQHER